MALAKRCLGGQSSAGPAWGDGPGSPGSHHGLDVITDMLCKGSSATHFPRSFTRVLLSRLPDLGSVGSWT